MCVFHHHRAVWTYLPAAAEDEVRAESVCGVVGDRSGAGQCVQLRSIPVTAGDCPADRHVQPQAERLRVLRSQHGSLGNGTGGQSHSLHATGSGRGPKSR